MAFGLFSTSTTYSHGEVLVEVGGLGPHGCMSKITKKKNEKKSMGTSFSFSFGCHNSIPFDGRITLIMNWKFHRPPGGGGVEILGTNLIENQS